MKTIKILVLVLMLVAIFTTVSPVHASDPFANVTGVTVFRRTMTITGTMPCCKWQPYATQYAQGRMLYINVYVRELSRGYIGDTISFKLPVTIQAPDGTYNVYVNGKYWLRATFK